MGVNFTVMFLARGNLVHRNIRGTNLVTKYGFLEGSYVIQTKPECKNIET